MGDLAAHPGWTLGLLGLGFLALSLTALPAVERRLSAVPPVALLAVAALLRLLLLPLPPTLSDDAYRYLWDGRVVAAGANPYRLPPDAPELTPLRDELWQRLPHRQVPTVYPPLALAVFTLAARLPAPLLALKTLLAAADLAGCLLLLRLARRLGLPAGRMVWYAWNPLVVLEVAGMGHVDALGAAAAVAAVLALTAARPRSAGAAAAAGVLAKLAPLAALPAWARSSGRPWAFAGVALGAVAVASLPVLVATGGVPPGLVAYGVSWEFNGPLHEPLWRGLAAAGADRAVAHGLDQVKQWIGHHEAVNRLYPYAYPQFLAKLILAAGMLAVVHRSWRAAASRRGSLVAVSGWLFGGLLLLSATVYPWYLLWVLPWAALARHPAWLALAGLSLLSYLPQLTTLSLWPWVFALQWVPFFFLLAAGARRRWWSTP